MSLATISRMDQLVELINEQAVRISSATGLSFEEAKLEIRQLLRDGCKRCEAKVFLRDGEVIVTENQNNHYVSLMCTDCARWLYLEAMKLDTHKIDKKAFDKMVLKYSKKLHKRKKAVNE